MTREEKKRCMCKTEEGKRCHNKADFPSIYCYLHKHCKQNHRVHHHRNHRSSRVGYGGASTTAYRSDTVGSSSPVPVFATPSYSMGSESSPSPRNYSPQELAQYLNSASTQKSPLDGEKRSTPLELDFNSPSEAVARGNDPFASPTPFILPFTQLREVDLDIPPGFERFETNVQEPEILVPSSEAIVRQRELENSLFIVQSRLNEERQNPAVAQDLVRLIARRLMLQTLPPRPTNIRKFRFQPPLVYLGPLGKFDTLQNRLGQVGSLRRILLQNAFKASTPFALSVFSKRNNFSGQSSQVENLDDPIKLFLFKNFPNLNERQRYNVREKVLDYIQSFQERNEINIEAILNNLVVPAQLRNADVQVIEIAEELALEALEDKRKDQLQDADGNVEGNNNLRLVLAIKFIVGLIITVFSVLLISAEQERK